MEFPGGEILPDQEPYKALYIHVPFCKSKCAYCDFKSRAIDREDPAIAEYIDELVLALRAASRADLLGNLETVYIGGGTPSHIGNKELSRLLYALAMFMHLTPDVECTLEVNPESLTEAMVKDLFALGVTRLSMGVQSFNDEELKMLGRAHDAKTALDAIELAKLRFTNISIDLMCGLPGQTIESFENSLRTAIGSGITHISIYPLQIEEGTSLAARFAQGEFQETEEELSDKAADMMELAARVLAENGFHRYEVASYAKEGFESRHNTAYWTGKPYLGVGTGATTMKQNPVSRVRYADGEVQEELDRAQMLVEDLMLGMRRSAGVSQQQVEETQREVPGTQAVFHELIEDGLAVKDSGRFKPTDKGWLCGNVLYGKILDLST